MNNEKSKKDGGKTLYTLIPLEDFKGLVGGLMQAEKNNGNKKPIFPLLRAD